jgi:hypothetical protein
MVGGKRDYSYDERYESSPEQLAHRAARSRARYLMIKKYGHMALENKDVDHIKSLKGGGSMNAPGNLRIRSIAANRGDKTF